MIGHGGLLRAFTLATKNLPAQTSTKTTPSQPVQATTQASSGMKPATQPSQVPGGQIKPSNQTALKTEVNLSEVSCDPFAGFAGLGGSGMQANMVAPHFTKHILTVVAAIEFSKGSNSMAQAKQVVGHAYHCRNNNCPLPKCFETKCKLLQVPVSDISVSELVVFCSWRGMQSSAATHHRLQARRANCAACGTMSRTCLTSPQANNYPCKLPELAA